MEQYLHLPLNWVQSSDRTTCNSAYKYELSDDKKFALVEFVVGDRSACSAILGDQTVKTFLKGKDKQEDIEAEFKKQKKDFDFKRFGVRIP